MDRIQIASELHTIGGRGTCTDAERRAARAISRALREMGRRPSTQAVWVRPGGALVLALLAGAGVAASIVSVGHPEVARWIALGALPAVPLAPLLSPRRLTQWVWAPGALTSDAERVRLLLACRADAQPAPLAARLLARAALPGPRPLLAVALALLATLAELRVRGSTGVVIGALQLVPSAACIALVGGFLDELVTRPGDSTDGPQAALAVLAALDRNPPARLAPEVVIAGPQAMGSFTRAQRRAGAESTELVVFELRGGARGYVRSDGAWLPRRLDPRLAALLARDAAGRRGRSASPAAAARTAGWPAIALEGRAEELVELTLAAVAALDRDLAQGSGRQATESRTALSGSSPRSR